VVIDGRSVAVIAALVSSACGVDRDYDDTRFRCPPSAPDCPDGFTCVAGVCEPLSAPDADPDGDGGTPDGPPDVCALAALAPDNDLCAEAIDVATAARAPGGTTVYGDTTGYGGEVSPGVIVGCTEAPMPGVDAMYRFDATTAETVELELRPLDWDGAIYLLDGCSSSAPCEGGSENTGVGAVESATITLDHAATYYVIVDAQTAGRAGCFALDVAIY
jgi:hypothetical protein